jgi:hypothetical protein
MFIFFKETSQISKLGSREKNDFFSLPHDVPYGGTALLIFFLFDKYDP